MDSRFWVEREPIVVFDTPFSGIRDLHYGFEDKTGL